MQWFLASESGYVSPVLGGGDVQSGTSKLEVVKLQAGD